LFAGKPVSHLGICGSRTLKMISAYRREQALSSSAHVPELSAIDTQFLFYPGDWQVVFDGVAMANRESKAARVQAVRMDTMGNEMPRVTLLDGLAQGAKLVALLDAVFAGLPGAAIKLECSEPLSLLLLRGTR
jgi:hypothetical protein